MIVDCDIPEIAGTCLSPSIADVTDIGGVIIPSASSAAPPIIAGITSQRRRLLTSAYNEKNATLTPIIRFQGENYIFDSSL